MKRIIFSCEYILRMGTKRGDKKWIEHFETKKTEKIMLVIKKARRINSRKAPKIRTAAVARKTANKIVSNVKHLVA